ncbi:MAG TPA: magnesium transporter [Elusimicrobia bacterium]|nr:magnesium transporter [Elusimicrobiota bacterium]
MTNDKNVNLKNLSVQEKRDFLRSADSSQIKKIFRKVSPSEIAEIIGGLPSDELVDILEVFPKSQQTEILENIDTEKARKVSQLLLYGKDTAGGMMAVEFSAFNQNVTIEVVIDKIRKDSPDTNRAFYIYVVDDMNRLLGVISLRDLITKPPQTVIRNILKKSVVSVPHILDREATANFFQKYNFLAIPVVDEKNCILGIITADDVSRAVRQEATEDLIRITGISSDDLSIDAPLTLSLKKRLPWLVFNMFLDVIAVSVVAIYQGTIQAVVAIAVLMPVISDMSGNTGFQGLTLIVRGFALGKISTKDFWKIFRRQSILGLITGIVLGLEVALLAYLWKWNPYFGLVAGAAMFCSIYIAGFVGIMIPLFLKFIKVDPAVATGPVLTTITDLTGFFITLSLATKAIDLIK